MPTGIYKHKKFTKKHKENISKALKAKKMIRTLENKKKISSSLKKYNKNHLERYGEEVRKKSSKALKKWWSKKENKAKKLQNYNIDDKFRDKTYEEIYGKEKAEQLKELRRQNLVNKPSKLKNRTYKEIYGDKVGNILRKRSLAKGGTGIPRENSEYGAEFDNSLKEQVRDRDKYKCKMCGCSQLENGQQLDVHHIDYNKRNCKMNNLITLCRSCHLKTNSKNKEYWINLLKNEVICN